MGSPDLTIETRFCAGARAKIPVLKDELRDDHDERRLALIAATLASSLSQVVEVTVFIAVMSSDSWMKNLVLVNTTVVAVAFVSFCLVNQQRQRCEKYVVANSSTEHRPAVSTSDVEF